MAKRLQGSLQRPCPGLNTECKAVPKETLEHQCWLQLYWLYTCFEILFINMTGFVSFEETGIGDPSVEEKLSILVCHWSHLCRTASPLLTDRMWRKSLTDWHKDFNRELPSPRDFWAWGKLLGVVWLSCNISEIASLLKMEVEASDGLQVGWNLKMKNTACTFKCL